jgi:hypothetical protein
MLNHLMRRVPQSRRYPIRLSLFLSYLLNALLWPALLTALPASATQIPQATAAARHQQQQEAARQVRPENYDLSRYPITAANERHWRIILWNTAVTEPQAAYVSETIAQILTLSVRPRLSEAATQTVDRALPVATQLYLSDPSRYPHLEQQFLQIIAQSRDPQWIGMALSALTKAGTKPDQHQQWRDRIQQRFPNWAETVPLYTTIRDTLHRDNPQPLPPLSDLLSWSIAPNQLQLYVFCRPDRGVLCQAILKDRSGKFVRQSDGQLWTVSLAGRSLHNLSWNFTHGQTPQGIYRIEGTVPQPDTAFFRAYGLFPLVQLFVPFESDARQFLPNPSLMTYQTLLPPTWRNYFPIQQSYWAGKAGRGEFRIHGSGEAPSFFSNNSRYPASAGWNPAIGCLSALEQYDETGKLQQADMPKILEALTAAGGANFTGYLVVVDVPGANTPLTLEELETAIAAPSS